LSIVADIEFVTTARLGAAWSERKSVVRLEVV
jgi:hypothetical protein